MREFIFMSICVPTLALAQGTTNVVVDVSGRLKQALTDRNCPELARLLETEMKEHPPEVGGKKFSEAVGGQFDDSWELNVRAWQVFERCSDESTLAKALQWIESSIKLAPLTSIQFMDTRANLLYKMGRREEAIATEEAALKEDRRNAQNEGKEKGDFSDGFTATIEKMKKGEPTWPQS